MGGSIVLFERVHFENQLLLGHFALSVVDHKAHLLLPLVVDLEVALKLYVGARLRVGEASH